jgi:hypothetical protein
MCFKACNPLQNQRIFATFVTLERSGWRPLAGGWSVQQSEDGSQQFIPQLWLIFQVAIFCALD